MRFTYTLSLLIATLFGVHASIFPSTIDGFSWFLVFDTPILNAFIEKETTIDASRYNLVWGASDRILPMYRATNPDIELSYYIPWSRDWNGTRDLAWWQANKPEWVLYRCDKVTPAGLFTDPHIALDIGNPDVIDWQLENTIAALDQFKYDGIAADNYAVGNAGKACGVWKNGEWVAKYTEAWEDQAYNVDALKWLTTFYTKFKSMAPGKSFGINFSLSGMSPSDAKVMSVVEHTDYIMDEAGVTKWGGGPPTAEVWNDISTWIENIQVKGKHYFGINQFADSLTHTNQEWGMASYLMSKNAASSMVNTVTQGYGIETYNQAYVDLKIGKPVGKRYFEDGVWKRQYTNGFVIVNAGSESKSTTLPAGWEFKDTAGTTYTSAKALQIAGTSGLVLGATVVPAIPTEPVTTGTAPVDPSVTTGSGSGPVPQNPSDSPSTSSTPTSATPASSDSSSSSSGTAETSGVAPTQSAASNSGAQDTSNAISLSFSVALFLVAAIALML